MARWLVPLACSSRIVARCDWVSMVLFCLLLDSLGQLRQQPRGVLDLAMGGWAVGRWIFEVIERAAGDGDDLIEIAFQRSFCWLPLLPRSQKQGGLGENAFAGHAFGIAPSVVEVGGLAGGPMLAREDLGHALALFWIDSRRGCQIAHGDLSGDLAFAHQLLRRFRQRFHERKAACDPGCAAVETPRQIAD